MSDQPTREFGPIEGSPRIVAAEPRFVSAGDRGRATPGYEWSATPYGKGHSGDGRDIFGGGEGIHLTAYLKVIYKRRWLALTTFLIVMVSVGVSTFSKTPMYQAHAQILIEKEATNVVTFKEAFEQKQDTDDYYQTQYKLLQSRALARRTLDALKLWDRFQAKPKSDAPPTIRERMTARLADVYHWIKPVTRREPPLPDETEKESDVIDGFLSSLEVSPVKNSRLVDISYASADPALCTTIANALAKAYIEQDMEFKFLSSKEATDWLGERLAEQRKQVDAGEQALQRYREQTDAVSLEERQNIVVQKLNDLSAAVTRAKTERIQKEALYHQLQGLQNNRTELDTFPAISANVFIQQQKTAVADLQRQQAQLSEKLGPNHPDIVKLGLATQTAEAKLQGEIAKVVQAIRNEYLAAEAQEQSLTTALDQQKRDALELNRKGIEYGTLTRAAVSNRQIFAGLLQRMTETGISSEIKSSHIRIVDLAERPRAPSSPNHRNDMLLALLGGGMLGVGLAFFFEYIDSRIKSPDELKQHLGLPFLGMVPSLFGDATENLLISNGVPTDFAESFRSIRTNLLFSSAEESGRTVVITSTGPGEGKTVVATNLAVALAQAGQRVLFIDADMRRPRAHRIFDVPREPGLSNVLVGNAKASESVRKTTVSGLWILPAGLHPPNPAELLGSKRFKEFMASVVQHFDWVIVDTPPVMTVTDASLVAHETMGVVFVVGSEMTSRHVALRAIEQLEQAKARFIGAILNRVDLKHNAYYYSHYYRREYYDYYAGPEPGTGA